jgi:hypothetical protein
LANNGIAMNVSTLQTENAWQGVQASGANVLVQPDNLKEIFPPEITASSFSFRGRLEIPGITLPEQEFTASSAQNKLFILNTPENSWPEILIELGPDPDWRIFKAPKISMRRSDRIVEAVILFTRVMHFLIKAGECALYDNAQKVLELKLASGFQFDDPFISGAKLFRKLLYIEDVFRRKFRLPGQISQEEIGIIEMVFRGITEGEFSQRVEQALFKNVPTNIINLDRPSFGDVGSFSHTSKDPIPLFGEQLDVGSVTIHLEKAVLDNQVTCRFERYARQTRKYRMRRLNQFKQKLAREEPQELVDLIDEPLQNDVSADEAFQIAVGWQLYNRLPDRYYPQEPQLDEKAGCWRVSIHLAYARGESAPVGELSIDLKTGKIIQHTPIEEVRSRGKALVETMLHAR